MNKFLRFIKNYIIFILLVLLMIISPARANFLKIGNILNILRIGSLLAILSCGQAIVRTASSNGIDLSLGGVMAYSAYLGTIFIKQGAIFQGFLVSLALGAVAGFANGLLISKLKLPPFASTFGVSYMARSIGFFVAKGVILYDMPPIFRTISTGYWFGIPVLVYIMVAVVFVMWFLMTKTNFGRNIYCIGTNKSAASLCGVNVDRTMIIIYTISGLIAGFVGLLFVSRLNAAETTFGEEYVLQSVTACILAGVGNGKGNIGRVIIGAYILSIITNGMNLLAIDAVWQDMVFGGILIVGLIVTYAFEKLDEQVLQKKLREEISAVKG